MHAQASRGPAGAARGARRAAAPVALRAQRRRLDRAPLRRRVSEARRRRRRGRAASLRRGCERAQHRGDARPPIDPTDLRARLARYHADPDSAFFGWNDIWLDPAFRAGTSNARWTRIRCPVLAIQGEDDEYGTMAQIDRLAPPRAAGAARQARAVRTLAAPRPARARHRRGGIVRANVASDVVIDLRDIRYVRLGHARRRQRRRATRRRSSASSRRGARTARATFAATDGTTRSRISKAIRPITPSASTCATLPRSTRPPREIDADGSARGLGHARRVRGAPRRALAALHRPERQRDRARARRAPGRARVRGRAAKRASPAFRTSDCARRMPRATRRSGRACAMRACPTASATAPLLRIDAVHHKLALFPSTHAGRAARQSPGRGRRRRDARVLLPARARRADRVRTGPASRPRRRSSSTSRVPTGWSTSIRPACG